MKILVVSETDACCGPMAAAFLRDYSTSNEVVSAGRNPLETIDPMAVTVMKECLIDLSGYREFKDSALKDALMKWIKTSVEKSDEEKEESWTKTWNEYIDKLVRQNSERTKLVPQACRLGFKYANDKTNKTFKDLVTAGRAEIAAMDAGAEKDKANAIFENMLLDIRADLFEREIIDENTEVKALNYLDTLIVSNEFKTEGGLCNDGKTHL